MTRSLVTAAALLLALPLAAHAHFFRSRTTAAYAPAVVVAGYSYPVAVPVTVSAYPAVPPPVVLYDPLPVYMAQPSPVCVPVLPGSVVPQTVPPYVPPYAPPSAAPPSGLPAAPGTNPAPTNPPPPSGESPSSTLMTSAKTSEPSFYDVYAVAARGGAAPAADRRTVCFWNLSRRDVVLKVAGRRQTLPPGARSRLELGRQFVWQVEGRPERSEDMAADAAGLEVVIRR
jgi:hypothetical protein